MDAPQMAELITDLYQARPEAKEYLDFFAQPDIDKRLDKAKTNIRKELFRTSRGRNRGRSTRVKRFIKDIVSLNPGAEAVVEIMTYAVVTAAQAGSDSWVKETTQRAMGRLLADTVIYADAAGLLDRCVPQLEAAIDAMNGTSQHSAAYRRTLRDVLRSTLEAR